jgi:integrase
MVSEPSIEPAGEILIVRDDASLPQRRRSAGTESIDERLTRAIASIMPDGAAPISEIGFTTALAAMADNSKAAMAADLACYTEWCARERRAALPADPENLVRYITTLERRGHKPSTLARRIASLGSVHRLTGVPNGSALPTNAPMVRAALKGVRRRKGAAQRQAAPLRLGHALDPNVGKGFTLQAMLDACSYDLQGLRDAALLSVGYDAGLRVSELVAVEETHIDPQEDGSGTLFIPSSKTDQEQQGAWAWLSPDTMRRVGAWLQASGIKGGPLFRRVGVDRRRARAAVAPVAYEGIPGNTRNWRERMDGKAAEQARTTYSIGVERLTRQGVNAIYRRVAHAAFDKGLVKLPLRQVFEAVKALSTHSLRVGLTQDLFAAGEDGVGIAQALRWTSPTTALRYGRKLAVRSNVAARVLSRVRL